jgi:DNA-binding IclR family transcriptional regulator
LRGVQEIFAKLTARDLEVLRVVAAKRRGAILDDVVAATQLSHNQARTTIAKLRKEGLVSTARFRFRGLSKYFATLAGRDALHALKDRAS